MNEQLLIELRSSHWAISETARSILEHTAIRMLEDPEYKISPIDLHIRMNGCQALEMNDVPGNPFDSAQDSDNIAIIPLCGIMTKYSSWYKYGCDELANFIRLAEASSKVSGVILLANTPGGDVQSVFQLQDAISHMTKPIVTLTDGYLCSAGLWAASFTNKIFALNEMNMVGSIGILTELYDFSEQNKKYGVKTRTIYPPESKYKNLPERNATSETPDDDLLITEILSPLAVQFQNTIRANLPGLDLSVEGIVEGREFYARDAVKFGLVHGIMSMDQAISYIKSENEQRKSIARTF